MDIDTPKVQKYLTDYNTCQSNISVFRIIIVINEAECKIDHEVVEVNLFLIIKPTHFE